MAGEYKFVAALEIIFEHELSHFLLILSNYAEKDLLGCLVLKISTNS